MVAVDVHELPVAGRAARGVGGDDHVADVVVAQAEPACRATDPRGAAEIENRVAPVDLNSVHAPAPPVGLAVTYTRGEVHRDDIWGLTHAMS